VRAIQSVAIRSGDRLTDRGIEDVTEGDPAPQNGSGCAESTEQTSIFFSYSREDQARAVPIIHLIEQAGYAVWWDGLLAGGDRFSQTTEAALDRARAVVVLWSRTSINSHWVHDEATRGRDRRVLVPLSLDGSPPPLGFGQFQAIDLSQAKINAKDAPIQRMLRAIEALHDGEATKIDRKSISTPSPANRRKVLIGGAAVIALSGCAAAWWTGLVGGGGNASNRVAILPFNNIGDDPKQAYVAEGLANEIRTMLAQNRALEVIGQASSETFERGKEDPVRFAEKLRAGFLIDGAVQIAGEALRVTIDLIEGKTGVGQAPRTFEKPMGDILSVQREIGSAIAAELSGKIGAKGSAKSDLGGTHNAVAYDHYLRGKDLYAHAKDEAEERQAVVEFDAAIAADPEFASAHAGRAKSLVVVAGQYGSAAEIEQYYKAALMSARRAIQLAPKLATAHSTLALLLFQDLDVKAARSPFDLSRQLGEGEAPVMAMFAYYCAATGRDREAVVAVDRALLLDPLNANVRRIAGSIHYAARRLDEAISYFREAVKLSPDLPDTHARIGMVLLMQNKNSDALKEFERDTHKWSKLAGVAIAQHRLGNAQAAKSAMAGLVGDTDTVSLYQQAQVLAQWGDLDAAVSTLERARDQRDGGMTASRYDPIFDPLRKRPRFILLLKSLGFD
jgi:TolB-like protein/tetratricopeptide (TPR) repeat protein